MQSGKKSAPLHEADLWRLLAKLRVRPEEFEKFVAQFYVRAAKRGYTPAKVLAQALEIARLEEKHRKKYEQLKADYEETVKQLSAGRKELERTAEELRKLGEEKSRKLEENALDEQKLENYLQTKSRLTSAGLDVDRLEDFEKALAALDKLGFKPNKVVQELNEIRDLQAQRASLRQELIKARQELDKLSAAIQARRREAEEEAKEQADKVERLEKKYAHLMREIVAYSELRALGIDGKRVLAWNDLMASANLDAAAVEAELARQGHLKNLETEAQKRIAELEAKEAGLKKALETLTQQREAVTSSIEEIKASALQKVEEVGSKVSLSLAELGEKAKSSLSQVSVHSEASLADTLKSSRENIASASEDAKKNLSATVSELSQAVESFSRDLSEQLAKVQPQLKAVSQAFDAGERIGRYKTILPLLELMEDGRGREAEALIAMWNISSRFNMWLTEHYAGRKREISESLDRLITAVNEEIQNAADEDGSANNINNNDGGGIQ